MLFDQGLKDGLLIRSTGGRPPLVPWLVGLLLVVLVAWGGVYTVRVWRAHRAQVANEQAEAAARAAAEAAAKLDPARTPFEAARQQIAEQQNVLPAREQLYAALAQAKDPALTAEIEALLTKINFELLLCRAPMPEKVDYIVQEGDAIKRIAARHNTTVALIVTNNALKTDTIHAGDKLRVFQAPLTVEVSKSRNDLVLQANGRFFKRYRVGSGKYGTTPVGQFVISEKVPEPPWWKDGKLIPYGDPANVIGTRWLQLKMTNTADDVRGYGIHGTWAPETVGKQASEGCVRMINRDVEELFLILPYGAQVTITE